MLNQDNVIYQGLVWCPTYLDFGVKVAEMRDAGQTGLTCEKGPDDIGLKKPTLFSLNDFTRFPQYIVDTYGIPTYKEGNPAVFAAVSFPFFFGVMFGDVMHGSLLFIFSLYLCLMPDKKNIMHDARYFLLMSGFFSAYCGLIYNDLSSMNT